MGKLFVVGLGPGSAALMTPEAKAALDGADLIMGYGTYLDLIRDSYPDKHMIASGMRQERERCREALEQAARGLTVALVCSGDAGVYGMASPVLELASAYPRVEIEIIPGITAALYGSARLGAPLGHDFCLISLSDLLTPWNEIVKRLHVAVAGDFVIALYNPASRHRPDHLRRACEELLAAGRKPETPCGLVRNGAREGEAVESMTLADVMETAVDMFTVVFIGSSQTVFEGPWLVTPRGYGRP